MATVKQVVGTATALTVTGLSTLASGTYVTSATYNCTTNQPLDLFAELNVTPNGTTTGNQQAVLFAQGSLDGTTWQSGPGSGTTTTDEGDLTFIGALPLKTASGAQVKAFGVSAAYGGSLPPYVRFVVKNDCGVAFSAGSMRTTEISATVV
jgi:hypothetical protein